MFTRPITTGLVLLLALTMSASAQSVWYVDADSPNDGPGNDWEHAYHYLQNALAVGADGDEIRVAEGTHRPDESTANPNGTDDRTATFQLVSGVRIEGGYAGYGAADPDERNIPAYETILSGNIGSSGIAYDNSYHVVTSSGTDATAVLDGVTVADGFAEDTSGGGVYNAGGSPTLVNCTVRDNWARYGGGGMWSNGGPQRSRTASSAKTLPRGRPGDSKSSMGKVQR